MMTVMQAPDDGECKVKDDDDDDRGGDRLMKTVISD